MLVEIPIADAVDKLTILQIKSERIKDPAKRKNVAFELEYLQERLKDILPDISFEFGRLIEVNGHLWATEDHLRRLEKSGDFGEEFVALARLVYITNDERAAIKREINLKCGSRFVEEKEHNAFSSDTGKFEYACGLSISEQKVCSQNGEDGVIESIFAAIGTTDRYFVEFGCGDGRECNTAHLSNHGWQGLLMDSGEHEGMLTTIRQEHVTAENINCLFDMYDVPDTFDLLSIDIDGNDYWVWKAIERKARVVVIEYNAHIAPDESRVIEYDPDFAWNGSDYFGASLRALVELAETKGYALIYCERTGANAFFVRNDLLPEEFVPLAIEILYRPPNYLNQGLSWPRDPHLTMIPPSPS